MFFCENQENAIWNEQPYLINGVRKTGYPHGEKRT
jgi:hypothetical protein